MVKKGVISAFATIGYGLIFVVVAIVTAVVIQIGINGIGVKDEPISGLEISSSKTLDMVKNTGEEESKIGSLELTTKNNLQGLLKVNIQADSMNLVLKIGSNFAVFENIENAEEYTFTTAYQSLSMPICAILTNGEQVLCFAKSESFKNDPSTLVDMYKEYKKNPTTPNFETDTDKAVLNVATTNTSEELIFSILGTANLENNTTVSSSLLKVKLTIRSSEKGGTTLTASKRPVHFLVTDENGNAIIDKTTGKPKIADTLTVGINEEFKLILATDKMVNTFVDGAEEKDYIRGGSCYIHAQTTDNLWKADALKINVDVPIETLKIKVRGWGKDCDPNAKEANDDLTEIIRNTTETYKDLQEVNTLGSAVSELENKVYLYVGETTANYTKNCYYRCVKTSSGYSWQQTDMQYFIKNDELFLSIETFPQNATNAVSSMRKNVTFTSNNFTDDFAKLENSKLTIIGESANTTGALTIQASMPEIYGGLSNINDTIVVQSAQLEIESITSKQSSIKLDVGEKRVLSADKLGIVIRSKHYTHGIDPSSDSINNLSMHYVVAKSDEFMASQLNSKFKNVISINSTNTVPKKSDKEWTFEAIRTKYANEKILLYVNLDKEYKEGESTSPSAVLELNVESVIPSRMSFNDEQIDLDITKYDTGKITGDALGESKEITISYEVLDNKTLTYRKWVYFLNDAKSGDLEFTEKTNINRAGSNIIQISKSGQIKDSEGRYSSSVSAIGDGKVYIVAYLVRTNTNGDPIDYFYNKINEDEEPGFVLSNQIDGVNVKIDNSLKGKYVVEYYSGSTCGINVSETLVSVGYFYDEELTEPVNTSNSLTMGTIGAENMGTPNSKILYVTGNSKMAFYNETGEDDESLKVGNFYIEAQKGDKTNSLNIEKKKFFIEDMVVVQITITSQKPDTIDLVSNLKIANVSSSLSNGSVRILAKDVVVENMEADWKGSSLVEQEKLVKKGESIDEYGFPTININVSYNSDAKELVYKYNDGSSFKLPNSIAYTYNIPAGEGNTKIVPYNVITQDFRIVSLSSDDEKNLKNLNSEQQEIGADFWDKVSDSTKIKLLQIKTGDQISNLKIALSDEYEQEKCVYLIYSIDIKDKDKKFDIYRIKFDDNFSKAVFKGEFPLTQEDETGQYQLSGGDINKKIGKDIWNLVIYTGTEKNDELNKDESNAKIKVSLSSNVSNYLQIDNNGCLCYKTGYKFSLVSNETTSVFGNSVFTITYTVFDEQNVVTEKSCEIYFVGYIVREV